MYGLGDTVKEGERMFEKYILVNPEKYKASFKQSMSTGKIFFDFSVNANSKKELFNETKDVLEGLTKIANDFNKEEERKQRKQEKKPEVKGLE